MHGRPVIPSKWLHHIGNVFRGLRFLWCSACTVRRPPVFRHRLKSYLLFERLLEPGATLRAVDAVRFNGRLTRAAVDSFDLAALKNAAR